MIGNIFLVIVGLLVGWNVPRPQWAKDVQAWVVAKYKELAAKAKAKFSE